MVEVLDKISKNFTVEEFSCNCGCGQLFIDNKLVNMMQTFRDRLNIPIKINCVNRCEKHNAEIPNSSQNSLHLKGSACDFSVPGFSAKELQVSVLHSDDIFTGGIGMYDTFMHIDTGKKRSWDNRKEK